MFWDKAAFAYDFFEDVYNRRVYRGTGKKVAELIDSGDNVLECACGTGAISVYIAPVCRKLVATDFSQGMLKQASRKLSAFTNVTLEQADITALRFPDASFDKVVAGNVIHLLPDPMAALRQLERVCKPGGLLIIPTYINDSAGTNKAAIRFLEKLGAHFDRQFDEQSYQAFFRDCGYDNVQYHIVQGRMACEIAVIKTVK